MMEKNFVDLEGGGGRAMSRDEVFRFSGLLPAIIQDADTHQVLMLGYLNEEALAETFLRNRVTFFSRSKNRLWEKGETSGNSLELVNVRIDCDQDTFLIRARPKGPTCHTETWTCFGEGRMDSVPLSEKPGFNFLAELEGVIAERMSGHGDSKSLPSYVRKLVAEGEDRVIQKVGEEAIETVIAAKNAEISPFLSEAADLVFHLLVLLRMKGKSFSDLVSVLKGRSS